MKDLVKAISQLVNEIHQTHVNTPWLNQKDAAEYLKMSIPTFLKANFPSHNLFEQGMAVERWNRNELDQEMLKR